MPPKKCMTCSEAVKNNQPSGSVSCCQCDRWVHPKCANLHPEVVKSIWQMYNATGHHFWACEGCNLAYATLTKRMLQYERDVAEIKKTVAENSKGLEEVTAKVDIVEKAVTDAAKSKNKEKSDTINDATRIWSRELCERESKKLNVVIYGLLEPPPTVSVGSERKLQDDLELDHLFKDMKVDVKKDDIKFTYRVGYSDEAAKAGMEGKPRPLCVGLRKSVTRENIFDQARHLGKSQHYYAISIVPDLTVLQRKEDKELMDEVEKKNAEMSEEDRLNWVYRCIGKKGERTITRSRILHKNQNSNSRGRGGQRGRGLLGRRRPAFSLPFTSPNNISINTTTASNNQDKDQNQDQEFPDTPVGETDDDLHGWQTQEPRNPHKRKDRPSPTQDRSPDLRGAIPKQIRR